jgi:hypothetical protein
VPHACNSSYSGGRGQQDCGSKPAWANKFARPYLGKTHHKKALVEWLKVKGLSSNPSTAKKIKKKNCEPVKLSRQEILTER